MAVTSITVDAPPSSVFAVLANPQRYETFVVGNSNIRRFDPRWPEEGSEFQHTLGFKPLVVMGKTVSLSTDHSTHLAMDTGMGVLGATITVFKLFPTEEGTRVDLKEEPIRGTVAWFWNKPVDMVLDWRNRWLLKRLKNIAEEQFARQRATLPPAKESGGGGRRHTGPANDD